MLFAYAPGEKGLRRLGQGEPLSGALWIDLYRPLDSQVALVEALGLEVPTLADMEEIEISNRLYREVDTDVMTVVLPGQTPEKAQVSGPVSFILSPQRLVTVRHHAPRPFETFPERADRAAAGCATPERLFLGLAEEIISRLADLLEGVGRHLDEAARLAFADIRNPSSAELQSALKSVGQQGEALGRIRLGLLSMERALTFATFTHSPEANALKALVKAGLRDLQSLEVHADFLSSRVSLAVDATLGLINLAQNTTVRIVSVVAVLFMPPTMVASVYGMNFDVMPELKWALGYPFALALMLGSAVATFLFFKWKKWL